MPKYESNVTAKVAACSAMLMSSYFVIDITSLTGEADADCLNYPDYSKRARLYQVGFLVLC